MTAKNAGILYRADSKVLLMKRRPFANMGGMWAFPAGKIEGGETAQQCAEREFFEETGKALLPLSEEPRLLKQYGGFVLFTVPGPEFAPQLNDEHTEYAWADPAALPEPLHPGIAEQIADAWSYAMDALSARENDRNGYVTIQRNPITRAGIFQYAGRSLPDAEDPDRIYNVYRPLEELQNPETIDSMKMLPLINEHKMLGEGYEGEFSDKEKHGTTGENIVIEGNDILAPIRIFSLALKKLIDAGKKGLSLGYRCRFEKIAGEFNGMRYDYIQRDIRGNHLALVNEGRSGTAVLDHHWACDSFDLALDTGEVKMADKDCKAEDDLENKTEMTVSELSAAVQQLLPLLETVSKLQGNVMTNPTNALDADEEKKDKAEDETSEEKKDKAEDSESDEKKDKAEDEDDDKKEKKDAMDSALNRLSALEKRAVPTAKDMRAQIVATDALARKVAAAGIGTFDHSAMDEADVVKYAAEKLGIKNSRDALDGYLAGIESKKDTVGFAMDSAIAPKQGGLLAKRLNGAQA
jgi:hypothetical protein